jgi:hypothetical protein
MKGKFFYDCRTVEDFVSFIDRHRADFQERGHELDVNTFFAVFIDEILRFEISDSEKVLRIKAFSEARERFV